MKRRIIISKLEANGWYLKRAGGQHDIYWHDKAKRPIPVKRHREIPDHEAREIFRQAELDEPRSSP